MEKEFNLSEKIELYWQDSGDEGEEFYTHEGYCIKLNEIKEFIEREFQLLLNLRDKKISWYKFFKERDKLAGSKLVEGRKNGKIKI